MVSKLERMKRRRREMNPPGANRAHKLMIKVSNEKTLNILAVGLVLGHVSIHLVMGS